MSSSFINDPEHWRGRAEEMRRLAEDMRDAATKEMMLRIARDCDGVLSLNVAATPHIFKEVRAASLDAMVSHVGDQRAAEQHRYPHRGHS